MSVRKRTWTTRGKIDKQTGERLPPETRTKWIVDYVDRQGERHIKTFDKKKEADARHAEVTVDVKKGVHVAASKSVTVAKAAEIWIEACKLEGLERGTLLMYEGHLKHILPVLGRIKLSALAAGDVAAFGDGLRKGGMSPMMTRKVLTSLGTLIAEAQGRGLVALNVARGAKRKKRKGGDRTARKLKAGVDIPLPEEMTAILAAAKGRWRPLLVTAAFTGLRASELRGLTWKNVDLKKNEIHVCQRADRFNVIGNPKSKDGDRTVPFGPVVANTLREWRLACPKGELGLVFPNGAGNIERNDNIRVRGLIPTVRAAELKDDNGRPKLYTGLHAFRHFYASWCIKRGLSAKIIQTHMGHAKIAMTFDVYGHLFPNAVDAKELADAELALVSV